MAEKRDYYEILGVERSATKDEIAVSYRKLALKYHPDRNPGDEGAVAKFKEAAEAFEVLGHAEKRAVYDRYGHAGLDKGGGSPHFHDVGDIFEAFGDIFGDSLFGEMFGGGRRTRRARRGSDIRCDVELDLLEAAHGTAKVVQFDRHQRCETCNGTGAKAGSKPETCPYCGGNGRVVQSAGILSVQTTCPSCHGNGRVIRDACNACHGSGFVKRRVTRKVDIPAGVDNGTQLRLSGEGEPSPSNGPPGDCYCVLHVAVHALFHREGQDLICQVPISYSQATLGAKVEVPTLDGPDVIEVQPGTQPGEVITLRGRGMPDPRHRGRGNLHVQVTVDVPKRLSERHEELLRELAEIENSNVTPKRQSFFDKLKKYFQSE